MPDQYSIDEQIACVKREIGLRERLYPRWVVMRKMAQAKADDEIATMKAALATLERVQRAATPSGLLCHGDGADRP